MRRRFWLLAVAALLNGCVTPEAVREFAAVSKEASAQYPPIVKDLTGSCVRRHLADTPIGTLVDARESAREQCAAFAELETPLLAAGKALTAYLAALAELAKGDRPGYDDEIKSLTGNIRQAGGFGDAQIKAVNSLASLIARTATMTYQRKHLAADIGAADAGVATLTEALSDIAQREYGRLLTSEQNALLARYRKAADGEQSKSALLYVEQQWASDLRRIAARRSAAESYVKILAKIRKGHHALAASSGNFNARELIPELKANADSIKSAAQDLRAAFL